ncbi:MAG: trigger factor [Zoogloeaceae bacterium]|jgi:trigger factor|nr:trigger factor [Zoogloeaceae bacterium]
MEDTAQNINPLERRLDISVPLDTLHAAVEKRLRQMSRSVKMPGFRPGKAPLSFVRQQHGGKAYGEALEEAIKAAFGKAVAEQRLDVACYPHIEPKPAQGDDDKTLEFSAAFEVFPEFVLGDVSGAQIERPVVEITDVEIDKTIEILRWRWVRYDPVERGATKGDRMVVSFCGKKDGEEFAGGSAENLPFVLGQNMLLPDFEAAVEGLKAGESKDFDLRFPQDYPAKNLAGETAQFSVTVEQVLAPVLPEVDAAFARLLKIENGDITRMRAEIESMLRHEVNGRIDAYLKKQVMEALLNANPIPAVPRTLVAMETRRMTEEARREREERKKRGEESEGRLTQEEEERIAESAKRRVTIGLIFAEVIKTEAARNNDLRAKPEQVRALIEDVADTYEGKPQETVNAIYADAGALANMKRIATENNVVAWTLEHAKVTDKTVTFEELMGGNLPE